MPSTSTTAQSLVDALLAHVEVRGEQTFLRYLTTGEAAGPQEVLTFEIVERRGRAMAARLEAMGLRGERVILLQPPGPRFLEAILGCFYAGVVAVPVALPDPTRLGRAIGTLRAVMENAKASAVLTVSEIAAVLPVLVEGIGLDRLPMVLNGSVSELEASDWSGKHPKGSDIAMLQYTSGATRTPRGVALTHGNLLANLHAITAGAEAVRLGVSWLPPYHDMGLVGGLFWPLGTGSELVMFSPLAFLQRPVRWMEALSVFGAESTLAPDFALALVATRVTDDELSKLDLSALRVCWCGADSLRAETVRRFHRRFAAAKLRPDVVRPSYGLAEATLMVSRAERPGPIVVRADAAALARGHVRRVGASDPTGTRVQEIVGNGPAVRETEIIAVDVEKHTACAPGVVGELWVRGPGVASGYFGRDAETAEVFGARLADGHGPWLRTGDLGVVDAMAGVLVCGRAQDAIVIGGRHLHPQNVEATIELVDPSVRAGCVVAFPVRDEEGAERIGVAFEIRPDRRPAAGWASLCDRVRSAVTEAHEVTLYVVALLPPSELPKTMSGKVQRRLSKEALEKGELAVVLESRTVGATPSGT